MRYFCFNYLVYQCSYQFYIVKVDMLQTIHGLKPDCSQSYSQIVLRPSHNADTFELFAHKNGKCSYSLELSNLVVCGCQREQLL